MICSKAVADAGNGFDVPGICYVRFNGFPQKSHRAGNATVIAALHLPGVFAYLLCGQYNSWVIAAEKILGDGGSPDGHGLLLGGGPGL